MENVSAIGNMWGAGQAGRLVNDDEARVHEATACAPVRAVTIARCCEAHGLRVDSQQVACLQFMFEHSRRRPVGEHARESACACTPQV
jgi:hypothetical protein